MKIYGGNAEQRAELRQFVAKVYQALESTAPVEDTPVADDPSTGKPLIEVVDNEDDTAEAFHEFADIDALGECIKRNMSDDGGGTWEEALMAVKNAYELLDQHSYSFNSVVFRFPISPKR